VAALTDIIDIEPEPNPAPLTIEKMRGIVARLREQRIEAEANDILIADRWGRLRFVLWSIQRAAFRRRFIRRYRRGSSC
jgi:hypothetical protein